MRQLTYSVEINRPITEVYHLARQVERQPEMMPEYLSCRIVDHPSGRMLLQRTAKIRRQVVRWLSWVEFRENEGLYFTHVGGLLDGMKVHWVFTPEGPDRTRFTITQDFHISHPIPGVGACLEKWIFQPKLRDIANRVIYSFKRACELRSEEMARIQ